MIQQAVAQPFAETTLKQARYLWTLARGAHIPAVCRHRTHASLRKEFCRRSFFGSLLPIVNYPKFASARLSYPAPQPRQDSIWR